MSPRRCPRSPTATTAGCRLGFWGGNLGKKKKNKKENLRIAQKIVSSSRVLGFSPQINQSVRGGRTVPIVPVPIIPRDMWRARSPSGMHRAIKLGYGSNKIAAETWWLLRHLHFSRVAMCFQEVLDQVCINSSFCLPSLCINIFFLHSMCMNL